jgi:hypothetical protein
MLSLSVNVHKLGVSNFETGESGHLAANAKFLDQIEVRFAVTGGDVAQ